MKKFLPLLFLTLTLALPTFGQMPGLIYQPPGGMGVTPLNPDGNSWSSISTSGYSLNDITESDIPYQPLPVPYAEPTSDLARGADCNFSDIVRIDSFDSGVYMYSDGTNLLFRFRQGSTSPGSKGYSILIDSDMRFGCCGPNADPNYIPKTTGIDGNPGFEIEIVLETNFQVAMYNVDGIDNPSVPDVVYPIASHHQRSVALTNNCDDPDYFHDFYIILADLYTTFGINANTPLRYAATTVMAPKPALGGPLSDINGGGSFEDIINYQCGTPIGITPTNSEPCSCTNPPTINGPIPSGTNVPITGDWSATGPLKPNEATIEVFLNGNTQGTTTTTDGSGWSMTLPGPLENGDTIYATAQATGEGLCDPDPQIIIVSDCTPANTTANPVITCVGAKGIKGTAEPNATIEISLFLGPQSGGDSLMVTITADPTGVWGWDGLVAANNTSNNICNSGSGDMEEGTYSVVATVGNCPSGRSMECLDRTGGSNPLSGVGITPVITTSPIEEGNSDIAGTATSGDRVRLFVNGYLRESTFSVGGVFEFVGVSPLYPGDVIEITAQSSSDACQSLPASSTVSCSINPPSIDSDANFEVAAGDVLTGTSNEEGATIDIFDVNAPTVSLGTATVTGGVWTSTVTAVAGTTYFATVSSACGTSDRSFEVNALSATGNRCGVFTNAPYSETSTLVEGTLSSAVSNTTVNLYIDGALIGTTVTSTTNWSISVPAIELYGGGVLTFGIQEPSSMEFFCPLQEIVNCSPLPPFTFTPPDFTIPNLGGIATFTLSSTTAGILYVIEDQAAPNLDRGISVFSQGTDFTLSTFPFIQEGEYDLQIKGMTFNGNDCSIGYPVKITVLNPLPVELVYFRGELKNKNTAVLTWLTSSEKDNNGFEIEHAYNQAIEFNKIGFVEGNGTSMENNTYAFNAPNLEQGIHYFRLKQIDFNGQFTYHNTIALYVDETIVSEIYPNVINENNKVLHFKTFANGSYRVEIISNAGQLVESLEFDSINNGVFKKEINLDRYAPGIYYVRIHNNNYQFTRKIQIE